MKKGKENDDEFVVSYVDTLLGLELYGEYGEISTNPREAFSGD